MSDEYALQITHQAVARACIAMDIKTSYSSVISVLSDVVKRYVKTVARNALDTAENAGRYTIGTQDVVVSLEQTVSSKSKNTKVACLIIEFSICILFYKLNSHDI